MRRINPGGLYVSVFILGKIDVVQLGRLSETYTHFKWVPLITAIKLQPEDRTAEISAILLVLGY